MFYKLWLSRDRGDFQWGLKLKSGEVVSFQDRWSLYPGFCNRSLLDQIKIARSKKFEGYENIESLCAIYDFSKAKEK